MGVRRTSPPRENASAASAFGSGSGSGSESPSRSGSSTLPGPGTGVRALGRRHGGRRTRARTSRRVPPRPPLARWRRRSRRREGEWRRITSGESRRSRRLRRNHGVYLRGERGRRRRRLRQRPDRRRLRRSPRARYTRDRRAIANARRPRRRRARAQRGGGRPRRRRPRRHGLAPRVPSGVAVGDAPNADGRRGYERSRTRERCGGVGVTNRAGWRETARSSRRGAETPETFSRRRVRRDRRRRTNPRTGGRTGRGWSRDARRGCAFARASACEYIDAAIIVRTPREPSLANTTL